MVKEKQVTITEYNKLKEQIEKLQNEIANCKIIEEEYRLNEKIISHMAEMVVIIRASDGIIVSTNRKFDDLLGYSPNELTGRHISVIYAPTEKPPKETANDFMRTLKNKGKWRGEIKNVKKDGTQFWSLANVTTFHHSEYGKVLVSVHTDITEQKKMLHSLNITQFAIDNAPDSVFWMNKDGGFTYVNEQACRSLGYTKEELLNLKIWEIDEDFPLKRWKSRWKEYTDGELQTRHLETKHKRKDGTVFPVEVVSQHFSFKNEEFHVSFVRDISERKKGEIALKESEEKFRIIFEQAALGVAQLNSNTGMFKIINKKYLEIIGYNEKEMSELTFMNITHPEDLQDDLDNMELLKSGKIKSYSMEKRYFHKNKSIVWVNLTVSPMWKPGETPNYHIAIAEDITERKLAAETLLDSEKRLKEANTAKEKFFSIISHDLRSPFNTILGLSDLLKEDYDLISEDEKKEIISGIGASSHHTYLLLENLLDWANSQQGRIEINKEKLDLKKLVAESITPYLPFADKKEINVDVKIKDQVLIHADKDTVRTAIGNLVNNGIKFTRQKGKVTITASAKKKSVDLVIKDNGTGMNQETIEKLFRIDECQSTRGTENEKGTGLGLVLCKEFIEKNGGSITVKSEVEKGSRFILSFPTTT